MRFDPLRPLYTYDNHHREYERRMAAHRRAVRRDLVTGIAIGAAGLVYALAASVGAL